MGPGPGQEQEPRLLSASPALQRQMCEALRAYPVQPADTVCSCWLHGRAGVADQVGLTCMLQVDVEEPCSRTKM